MSRTPSQASLAKRVTVLEKKFVSQRGELIKHEYWIQQEAQFIQTMVGIPLIRAFTRVPAQYVVPQKNKQGKYKVTHVTGRRIAQSSKKSGRKWSVVLGKKIEGGQVVKLDFGNGRADLYVKENVKKYR